MSELFVIQAGDGEILDTETDREKAIDARVRWMDGYPNATVEKYVPADKAEIEEAE